MSSENSKVYFLQHLVEIHAAVFGPCAYLGHEGDGAHGIFVAATNIIHVPEQDIPSGDFPTVDSPNPENPSAMAMAIAKAKVKDL